MNKMSSYRRQPLAAAIAVTLLAAVSLPVLAQEAAAEGETAQQLDTVIVRGIRNAQAAAIDTKRDSIQVVDSVSAEDIGKLPDVTITDSLQRVSGVQIRRSAGEGAQVNIRGLPQVQTTMNGELYLGAGGGDQFGQPNLGTAQPDFVDIPPTLFSGVDVIKSQTAADLEGGVSGTISLRTRRPFDLPEGITASGQVEASYGDSVKEVNELYSGLFSYRTDRWGALLSVSYSDSILANKRPSVWSNGGGKTTEQQSGLDWTGDGVLGSNNYDTTLHPREYYYQWVATELENRTTDRERTGVNGSFQFNINDSFTLIGDVAYTRLEDLTKSVAAQLHTNWRWGEWGPTYDPSAQPLRPGSIVDENGVVERGVYSYDRFQAHSLAAPSESESLNTNIELRYDNGGPFRGTVRWVHGSSERTYDEARADAVITRGSQITRADGTTQYSNANGLANVDAIIDWRGEYPQLDMVTDVTNPDNWQLMSTWAQGNRMKATLDAVRADGIFDFEDGVVSAFKFGVRYGERDYDYRSYRYLSPVSPGPCADSNLALYYYKDPLITDACTGYSEARLLPFNSIPGYWTYFNDFDPIQVNGLGANGLPAIDPNAMKDPVAYLNSLYPGNVAYTQPADSFKVGEKTLTGYFMADLEGTTGENGVPWRANVGVRVVQTKTTIDQYAVDGSQFIGSHDWNGVNPATGINRINKDRTDVLPSVNVVIDTSDEQKIRFGYNKAVARQNLPDLGRGLVVFYHANNGSVPGLPDDLQLFLNGRAGNPDLKPYEADYFNAAWEWYFADASLLNVGVFRINVENAPGAVTQNELLPDADGVVRQGGPVQRVVNSGSGTVSGFEVGYQQAFDFLPGWLSGFGTNLNYTYSEADTNTTDIDGNYLPMADNSKHQYNAIVWYQKSGFQARVAYNWRSRRFAQMDTSIWGDQLAIWNESVGYLDASLGYDITPNLTVYVQGTNLTGENERRYAQWSNHFYDQNLSEKRYYAGLRFRF